MLSDVQETPPPAETLLVVDDEAYIRELIGAIFSFSGYRVLLAQDGLEALEISRSHEGAIHLLLSDIVMPRMNGIILWRLFARERPAAKVLFISGYSDAVLSHEGHREGQFPFLGKPFTPQTLKSKVREILGPLEIAVDAKKIAVDPNLTGEGIGEI